MKSFRIIVLLFFVQLGFSQVRNEYKISFENAVHHEAHISAVFTDIESEVVSLRMSRTSQGKYNLHEFAKNVYNVKITDSIGNELTVTRPNVHQWDVKGHNGTINVSYTLFGDQGDGIYSKITSDYVLLNTPSAFMYIPELQNRSIKTTIFLEQDSDWKIATQLLPLGGNSFLAPDFQYFMDSPILLGNHTIKEHKIESGGVTYIIRLALQHIGTEAVADTYFDHIKNVIEEEKNVFGEYPSFDYGEYTFLAVYMPDVQEDGLGHRNSAVVTSPIALSDKKAKRNITTVAKEFFHAWNMKRIRPLSLDSYNYEQENLSEELWFSEGFTKYYANLALCRAGIISQEEFITGLTEDFNHVWHSPALQYYNPIEISKQAPFTDAANHIDQVDHGNTHISYYSYGNILALALDLSLREQKKPLSLDEYMKLLWTNYGKSETPFTIENLFSSLKQYAGDSFAEDFFEKHIYSNQVPDLKNLLLKVGAYLKFDSVTGSLGVHVIFNTDGFVEIAEYPIKGSTAYKAGLDKGDLILAIDSFSFSSISDYYKTLDKYKSGQKIFLVYQSDGFEIKKFVKLGANSLNKITVFNNPETGALTKRKDWLRTRKALKPKIEIDQAPNDH